jgi:hypothetical protein
MLRSFHSLKHDNGEEIVLMGPLIPVMLEAAQGPKHLQRVGPGAG